MCALILSEPTIKNEVKGTYSIVQKRHETKPEQANVDYCLLASVCEHGIQKQDSVCVWPDCCSQFVFDYF